MKKRKRRLKKKPLLILFFIVLFIILICNYCGRQSYTDNSNIKKKNEVKKNIEKKNDVDKKEFVDKKLSIVMVGDVLIHDAILKDAFVDNEYDFSRMFDEVSPILKDYDLRYCNQESIIGGKNLGIGGYPNFNSPDEIGKEIVDLGFNLVSLANNHAFDKGEEAINYSVSFWKKYENVITAGSYLSSQDRDDIKIYEMNGIKYAFLSYTTILNKKLNGKEYLVNMYDKDKVKSDIEKVSSADLIIVAMHWGNEDTNIPTKSQRDIAEYLSSLGVDLIIGAHPHVVQPITYIGDTLVIYSLGNFISNQLVVDENHAIGLLLGLDISLQEDNSIKFDFKNKELLFSYSDNGKNFKVIPFSKMNDNYLNDYKKYEEEYMNIINKEL